MPQLHAPASISPSDMIFGYTPATSPMMSSILMIVAQLFLFFLNARHGVVFQHALGVAQRAHDQRCVKLRRGNQSIFYILVHGGFFAWQ
jgi:hypothetical protein